MTDRQTLEVPVKGMDCAECTQHVRHAIAAIPGVDSVEVYLAAEKAVIRLDPQRVDLPAIRQAVSDGRVFGSGNRYSRCAAAGDGELHPPAGHVPGAGLWRDPVHHRGGRVVGTVPAAHRKSTLLSRIGARHRRRLDDLPQRGARRAERPGAFAHGHDAGRAGRAGCGAVGNGRGGRILYAHR